MSSSKSEIMVMSWKPVECLLWVVFEVFPKMEEFKLLHSCSWMRGKGNECDVSQKARLVNYCWVYVLTFIYGHALRVVTKRTRTQIQGGEITFLHRLSGLSLREKVRISVIRVGLRVELLFIHIWSEHSLVKGSGHIPPGGDQTWHPGHADHVSWLAWEYLGILPEEPKSG